jgi:hypothetical protein
VPIVGRLAGGSSQGLKLFDEHPGGAMTRKVFPQRVRSHRHSSTADLPARSLGMKPAVNSSLVAEPFP